MYFFQGIILVEHIIETWNLSSALWERHIELINDENSPNMLLLCYKVIFYPIGKTKRYIQVSVLIKNKQSFFFRFSSI